MPALRLRLDGAALAANWRTLARAAGPAACGAAVKADGYGLGAGAVVARLAAAGCRDFFVATWDEAAALGPLPEGCTLAVLHGARGDDMTAAAASPHRPVLNTPAQIARWRETGRPCDVMVDTGMNRLGLSPADAVSGMTDGLAVNTFHSHFACADEPGHPLNARQIADFATLRTSVPARRYSLANSAGIFLGQVAHHDLVRPGLALYGGEAAPGRRMAAVVQPEAEVLQVRDVRAGETVGYGATWTAPADARVAILNLGYADGYPRALSGRGRAAPMTHAARAERDAAGELPLLGRVSMDLIAVAAPPGIREGDWLAIDFDLPRTAALSGRSQYELLTGLGRRYGRVWS